LRDDGRPAKRSPGRQADTRRRRNGFTLLELVLVVMIIGILSAMAAYSYRFVINKARMTQAKTVLQHLSRTETVYFSNNSRYTEDLGQLDFNPTKYDYYKVSVTVDNTGLNYSGTAIGVGLMAGDCWTIVKDGAPVQCDNSVFK